MRFVSSRTVLAIALVSACAGRQRAPVVDARPKVEVPAWVDRVPEMKGKICALGSAEPTFYREDGKVYAAENARTQLAATLSVRVESVMVDIQSTNASENYVDQQYVTQAQTYATDAVLAGAQVLSYWYDETGARGRARATYALGCLDTTKSAAELGQRLQQAYPEDKQRNAAVRDRTKAMFDALEQQEAKQANDVPSKEGK